MQESAQKLLEFEAPDSIVQFSSEQASVHRVCEWIASSALEAAQLSSAAEGMQRPTSHQLLGASWVKEAIARLLTGLRPFYLQSLDTAERVQDLCNAPAAAGSTIVAAAVGLPPSGGPGGSMTATVNLLRSLRSGLEDIIQDKPGASRQWSSSVKYALLEATLRSVQCKPGVESSEVDMLLASIEELILTLQRSLWLFTQTVLQQHCMVHGRVLAVMRSLQLMLPLEKLEQLLCHTSPMLFTWLQTLLWWQADGHSALPSWQREAFGAIGKSDLSFGSISFILHGLPEAPEVDSAPVRSVMCLMVLCIQKLQELAHIEKAAGSSLYRVLNNNLRGGLIVLFVRSSLEAWAAAQGSALHNEVLLRAAEVLLRRVALALDQDKVSLPTTKRRYVIWHGRNVPLTFSGF